LGKVNKNISNKIYKIIMGPLTIIGMAITAIGGIVTAVGQDKDKNPKK
jgi:hypothetical protein